ncbi:hypothetical protein [uncultured Sphingorhabdus sp.]|uniref:hypothetical protein n=1 Tax=uncultured Sphingorhabdus sp. TaxID=1686106 RepID=UPI00260E75F1|nr:hypothetical protein [uncultured Sphingorhabdus sp.]HMS21298.1 hypothetical protein [Sphingorhabdus sp.]
MQRSTILGLVTVTDLAAAAIYATKSPDDESAVEESATLACAAGMNPHQSAVPTDTCLDVPVVIDKCMLGTWKPTGGGPLAYLKSKGMNIALGAPDSYSMTFNDDGTMCSSGGGGFNVQEQGDKLVGNGGTTSYSCTGDKLDTSDNMPNGDVMKHEYTRISGPAQVAR